jgi:hypothetical protein
MTFKQFSDNFKSLWGIATALTAAGPLALWSGSLQPLWPANAGLVAALFCAVALVIAFELGDHLAAAPLRSKRENDRGGLVLILGSTALGLGLIATVVYVEQYGKYIVTETQPTTAGDRQIRFIIGSEKQPSLTEPNRPDRILLREHLYQADEIWTSESIRNARFSLFVSFVLAFSLLTFGIGLFASRTVIVSRKSRAVVTTRRAGR